MPYILLIEDNQDNADLIIRALATTNMEIRHFTRGLEGSRESGRERPSIILLDFNLPDVDGRNLILTLKRSLSLGGATAPPIVAVTARANHLEQTLAQRFGVDAFVSKPFEPKMLLELVVQLLEKDANRAKPEAASPTLDASTAQEETAAATEIAPSIEKAPTPAPTVTPTPISAAKTDE